MATGDWLVVAALRVGVVVVAGAVVAAVPFAVEAAVPAGWVEDVAVVLESMEVLEPASPVKTPKIARPPVPAAPVASWTRRRALRRREEEP